MTGPHSETETGARQISVAELLARNETAGSATAPRRRRRRRGDSDAVTVAELTGEIPIIRDVHREEPEQPEPTQAEPANGRVAVAEPVADSPPEPVAEPGPAQVVADQPEKAYWSEPEPRWPQSPARPQRGSGPERSEYPRPLRHIDESDAAGTGAQSGAEDMSPDPVDHYGDSSVDVMDSEVREAEPAAEDSAYVRSYLQASEGTSEQTLFGGQSLADEVARRRSDTQAGLAESLDLAGAFAGEAPAPRRSHRRLEALWRGAVIVLQSILAVVFGAGLFIAFDQLWRWNSIVALVLSVLVILGLVVGVRVVRKTEDIASTLIAVAVGALVTLGPLALLQSG